MSIHFDDIKMYLSHLPSCEVMSECLFADNAPPRCTCGLEAIEDKLRSTLSPETKNLNKHAVWNRCCGRCDGHHDLCIADQECSAHDITGCEECFGPRGDHESEPPPTPEGNKFYSYPR